VQILLVACRPDVCSRAAARGVAGPLRIVRTPTAGPACGACIDQALRICRVWTAEAERTPKALVFPTATFSAEIHRRCEECERGMSAAQRPEPRHRARAERSL